MESKATFSSHWHVTTLVRLNWSESAWYELLHDYMAVLFAPLIEGDFVCDWRIAEFKSIVFTH